jgi:hypothetical protein
MAEERKLIQALHMDPEKLINTVMLGERLKEEVDLTGVDIKSEMEELKPLIKSMWLKWGKYKEKKRYSNGDDSDDQDEGENCKKTVTDKQGMMIHPI